MKKTILFLLLVTLTVAVAAWSAAESNPVTGAEIEEMAARFRAMTEGQTPLAGSAEDAEAEDGYVFQFEFGILYGDRETWGPETEMNALLLMDEAVTAPRGISISWDVNRVMAAIPCENADMHGTEKAALLYLEGDGDGIFRYGRVERDGQRIQAMEYGEADVGAGRRVTLTLGISGDGVDSIRAAGFREQNDGAALKELYAELSALGQEYAYTRVPRSLDGTGLAPFSEADLDFRSLSFRTAEPEIFGDNVEDVLIDNDDGTWLRRVDGDGFSAVFTCDSEGKNAVMKSFTILSPDLEGPRDVRLGDLFHEDFTRFPSGEGELSGDGMTEVLYGTVGQAPYGLAEYGDGTEMTLRYVTETLGGPDVELLLRYQNTVLSEIILHTLEEENAD